MKAAVFRGIRDIQIEEVAMPELSPDDILIRTAFCGICGTDLYTYYKGAIVSPGQIMGHEFSGKVVKTGSKVCDIDVGMRVCINPVQGCGTCEYCVRDEPEKCERSYGPGFGMPGGYAEYVRIPGARLGYNVHLLPPEVSDEEGAMIEPLSVAAHGVHLVAPDRNNTVVIFGAGAIGLCALAVLKSLGAIHAIVSDISPLRLEKAKQLGADIVCNPLEEDVVERVSKLTRQRSGVDGADIAVCAAGVAPAFASALNAVCKGGKVVCIALVEEPMQINPSIIVFKQVKLIGSFLFNQYEFKRSLDLVVTGKINLKPLITHHFPLDNLPRAFETQRDSKASVKVFINP
jgi:2-desacetyl-2-hydroxyethyl bacteriochlorophyllide A dehydrogenase